MPVHQSRQDPEGAIGGFVGTLIVAVVFSPIFQFSILHALALGIIIGIMAPLGDLAESILKRVSGVKDSGNIIPGHGASWTVSTVSSLRRPPCMSI